MAKKRYFYLARPINGVINFAPKIAEKQPKQFQKGDLVMIIEKTQENYIGGVVSSDLKKETTYYKEVIAHYEIGPLLAYREVKSLLPDKISYIETQLDGFLEIIDTRIKEGETKLDKVRRAAAPEKWSYAYQGVPIVFRLPPTQPDPKFVKRLYDALEEQSSKFEIGWKILKKTWNWKG